MLKGYTLRKYTVKDWLLIIITSSLLLQIVVTVLGIKFIDIFPEYLLPYFQTRSEMTKGIVYFSGALGTILSLPLTLIAIKKRKIPFFNRKQLTKEESFIIRGMSKKDWKFLIIYIPTSFLLYSLGNQIVVSIFGEGEAINQLAIESMFDYIPIWQIFLMTVVVAPIVEEVLFRGLILFSNGKIETTFFRVILSALLFGMIHNPTNIASFYNYVGMGFLFSYAAKRTSSLEAPMVYHFLNNLMAFLVILFYSR
ncbi:MAG: CPBP family intramembrane metalloprotease [Atopostipes suicloacalis]|nr:CPBP family intramembrane metalloprotease [Atopostipes suicloacalis]